MLGKKERVWPRVLSARCHQLRSLVRSWSVPPTLDEFRVCVTRACFVVRQDISLDPITDCFGRTLPVYDWLEKRCLSLRLQFKRAREDTYAIHTHETRLVGDTVGDTSEAALSRPIFRALSTHFL